MCIQPIVKGLLVNENLTDSTFDQDFNALYKKHLTVDDSSNVESYCTQLHQNQMKAIINSVDGDFDVLKVTNYVLHKITFGFHGVS